MASKHQRDPRFPLIDLPLEEIRKTFRRRVGIHENNSDYARILDNIVVKDLDSLSKVNITRCVCFGLGNIVPHFGCAGQDEKR